MTLPAALAHAGRARIIRADELDAETAQTAGMQRRAAVTTARTGANALWAGTVTIAARAKTGAHHHGDLESVIYVVRGVARMRWGERLEFVDEAGPGDFIYVPPFVPHQELNASDDLQLHCVLARSGQERAWSTTWISSAVATRRAGALARRSATSSTRSYARAGQTMLCRRASRHQLQTSPGVPSLYCLINGW